MYVLADNDFSRNANGNKVEDTCMCRRVHDSLYHNEFNVLYRRDKISLAITLHSCNSVSYTHLDVYKRQDKAKEIRHLQDTVLPKLKQQLADTKGIFKGKITLRKV